MPRIGWLCLTGLLSLVAWMAQVGPDDAVSNLALWYGRVATAPEWLKYPPLDTAWTIAFGLMAAVCLIVFFLPQNLLSPWPKARPSAHIQKPAEPTPIVVRQSRYAPPADANDIDVTTLTYKELAAVMEATGNDLVRFQRSFPYNATEERKVSEFQKKMAPRILWIYEAAKRRGHSDSTLDRFYASPQSIQHSSMEFLGKSMVKFGAGLSLYIDS